MDFLILRHTLFFLGLNFHNFAHLFLLEQQFRFQKPLKSIKVTENKEVFIECELDDWEGQVKWFKGDKELKPDPV